MPRTSVARGGRRAVFADRDGTIIEDRHYIADPADVALIPGSPEALIRLHGLGFALVVVTNQSGIGRGLYTLADYRRVAAETDRQLKRAGVVVDATYFCTDAPGGNPETTCRKPSPVLYRQAARDLGLTPAGSYFVGDKLSDVLPAATLGGTGILLRTGHGAAEEERMAGAGRPGADWLVADDLAAAAELIERLES
ncbi:MAG: HAD family hydrolase [Gemmatimonadota bacterium]|nr:HAD family hydrolase [Gemmatimonadota bacterium]